MAMVSSVDLFDCYANWCGSRLGWGGFDVLQNQSLEALFDEGG